MELRTRRRFAAALAALVAIASATALLASCGADSRSDGATVLTGLVVVPENGCEGCDSSSQFVRVQALAEDRPPETITCIRTSPRGVYDTADENLCPEESTATFEAAADGHQAVIVVADVEPGSGAQIGGVVSAPVGATKSKDFNGTTQIACVASVYLTAGNEDRRAGCVVRASCPGPTVDGLPCFTTVAPEVLDDDAIENLEEASEEVSDSIAYPSGVPPAVCAVIECTASGSQAAAPGCVASRLAS